MIDCEKDNVKDKDLLSRKHEIHEVARKRGIFSSRQKDLLAREKEILSSTSELINRIEQQNEDTQQIDTRALIANLNKLNQDNKKNAI